MKLLKKFLAPLTAVAFVLALCMLLLTTVGTRSAQAAETNIAVTVMRDQQAAMTMVATPDQVPRSAQVASLVTPTLEDTRVLGVATTESTIGFLVAVVLGGAALLVALRHELSATSASSNSFWATWGRNGKTGQVTIRAVRSIRSLLSAVAATFTTNMNARSLTASMAVLMVLGLFGSTGFTQLRL